MSSSGIQVLDQPLQTADGQLLATSIFEPQRADRTLVVFPGVGVARRAYRPLAGWLAERGTRVVTFDYRGVGQSRLEPSRRRTTGLSDWGAGDALSVFRWIEERHEAPIILGHSFGGQVLGLADDFRRAPAIMLIAAQFGAWRNWRGRDRWKLAAYWHLVAPAVGWLSPTIPPWLGLGTGLPSGVAREWSRWGRQRDYLLDVVAAARDRFAAISAPVRAYTFTDDPVAPRRATEHLLSALTGADIERRIVAPADLGSSRIGHFGFFRESGAPLWQEAVEFLRERVEPRVSAQRVA